jgi:anti-sigma factor RsiW
MNTTAHPIVPEEVMAFLDGELSAADAQAISAHLDRCAECSALVEQFRSTSLSLSRWNVEPVPVKLEESITDLAAKTYSGLEIGKANLLIRASLWTWKQWTVGLGAAAAALLLAITIATPSLVRKRMAPAQLFDAVETRVPKSEREHSTGSNGSTFAMDGQPASDQQSNVRADRIVTLNSPGVAAHRPVSSFALAPMIARTVSLSIVVKDFAASRLSLDGILTRHHGYSAQLSVTTPENAPRGLQGSLRIPSSELSSAVAGLKTLGRVENESQSGEEVTQQHTDLVARLKNSRETEQRFRTILQQRTGNVVEVLQVEEGIARVRGDIERMEAEQKALEHRVDFATVDLQLIEEYKAQLSSPAASVSTRIHNAFVAGYRNGSETVLGIVLFFVEHGPTLLIWLLILLLPVILVWRRYRKTLASV